MITPINLSFQTSCLVVTQIKQTDKCWLYVNNKKEEARIWCSLGTPRDAWGCFNCGL